MAWTEATLTTAIQDWMESSETTMVSNIPNFIKTVERRIVKETKLPVFRKNSTGTTTADNQYLSTPTDFLAPFDLFVRSGDADSAWYPIKQKDITFLRLAYPSATTTGRPKYYAMFDHDTFRLSPTPDAIYTTELHYLYEPASLVDDDDSWLSNNAENCLLFGCLVEACLFQKREDEPIYQEFKSRYEFEVGLLKSEGEGYVNQDDLRDGTKKEVKA